jgi:hypothetical protein
MKPLVTVVITTLNRSQYLSECIGSVLAQDYENLDILISDNGSQDETPVVTRKLIGHDPRVRVRRNESTVPVHEHFNQCLRAVRGEYFVLLHDDDRINSCFVSELVTVLSRHSTVNVVVPLNVIIDEHGEVVREMGRLSTEVIDGIRFVYEYWWFHGDLQLIADVTTVLFRTATIMQFGGYHSLGGSGRNVDNLAFLQCAMTSSVGFADRARFYWRAHLESFGSSASPRQIADAGREFIEHLRRDPATIDVFSMAPRGARKLLLGRIGEVTAREVVGQMKSKGLPLRLRTVLPLLGSFRNVMFWHGMLRELLRDTYPSAYSSLRWLARGS